MAIVSENIELASSAAACEVPAGVSCSFSATTTVGRSNIAVQKLFGAGLAIASRLRNLVYRVLGVNIEGLCWLRAIEIPRCWNRIWLERCALDRGVTLLVTESADSQPEIRIGRGTYINRSTIIDAHLSIHVGAECMIGPYCYITDADHGTAQGLAVSRQPMSTNSVVIKDGVWLGAHVTVLKGVTIGAGAVVGAGSVVTKNVPSNTIVVGVPAHVVRSRSPYVKAS